MPAATPSSRPRRRTHSPMRLSTPRGRDLARALAAYLGRSPEIDATCEALASRSNRLQALEVVATYNRSLTELELAEVARLEVECADLVATLPRVDGEAIRVWCDGDPRGRVVRVVVPNRPHDGNTWALGGEFEV